MSNSSRLPAVLAYLIPGFGWIYVYFLARKNELAVFHLKQSVGLILFSITTFLGWVVLGWLLAWIPYGVAVSMALFTLVIVANLYAVIAWIFGLTHALRKQFTPLPLFGRMANRLPI